MSIISWNCRGLGNPTRIQVLVDIIRTKRPVIFFLMETRLCSAAMEKIRVTLGFESLFTVDSVGLSGGLAIIWKKEVELDILSFSRNHIDASIKSEISISPWRFTGFYGCPERIRRKNSWNLLKHLSHQYTLPWILMGDFNDLLHESEKLGRIQHPQWLIQGRVTVNWIREKLDRILVHNQWLDLFGEARAKSFEAACSDHLPLALWSLSSVRVRKRRKFKFENCWLKETQCQEIVSRSWEISVGLNLCDRFEVCSQEIWKWGKDFNKNLQPQIDHFRSQLGRLRSRTDSQVIIRIELFLRRFSRDEIKKAAFGMHPDKSPGFDGLNPRFFQSYWDILGESIVQLCNEFLRSGKLPKGLNTTQIVLIPKKSAPETMADLRPIALCTVAYKILAKAMANKIKILLEDIISNNQSAFVP
ncbi:uncharacterized protein LOC115995850 [Ipomoea triloba]|uniref:uncharacterized protein LOC115995850 n=1 Tax=Ipomoea triloba TaxID=35885 RepID=UPI00125D18F3|nr:uncharacterized protein LOC115995850 [Ipomoea triloba]